jgi:hypothetical protein
VERLLASMGVGGGGGGESGGDGTTTITPTAGFCVKTFKTAAAAYEPSGKVFVNVCSHRSVERPQGAAGLAATDDHLDNRGVSNLQVRACAACPSREAAGGGGSGRRRERCAQAGSHGRSVEAVCCGDAAIGFAMDGAGQQASALPLAHMPGLGPHGGRQRRAMMVH